MSVRKGVNRYPRFGERIVPTVLREFLTDPLPRKYLDGNSPSGGKASGRALRLCDLDEAAWERFAAAEIRELSALVVKRVSLCQGNRSFQQRPFPRPTSGTRLESLHLENRTRGCLERDGVEGDLQQ